MESHRTAQIVGTVTLSNGLGVIVSGVRVRVGGRREGDNALVALTELHPLAKPEHERLVRCIDRFEFACVLRQCIQLRTKQRFVWCFL